MKKLIVFVAFVIFAVAVAQTYHFVPAFTGKLPNVSLTGVSGQKQTVVYEESVITKIVSESLPSVVTIGIMKTTQNNGFIQIDPFDPFGGFRQTPGSTQKIDQNIGSGFIVSEDGLIITNKHVVADTEATYKVLLNDDKKYDVVNIYRDPLNDLAILKINANGLKPLALGSSDSLKLGQMAIAIGTPLGEFRNSVSQGIVSGLGRGITAGSPYEGYVEKLDNVIQTDAAISPGNSGGPLLNSAGQVIGVNAAIATSGQNIGFAIPVNTVKEILAAFKSRGSSFIRPYIGVRYQVVDRKTAIANSIAEGAYVVYIAPGSPAETAGIQVEDIVTEFDGTKVTGGKSELSVLISAKKVGDTVKVKLWRNGDLFDKTLTIQAAKD